MARVARYLHEVWTALDANLLQRFGRRELARFAEGVSYPRTLGPRGNAEADTLDRPRSSTARALRGLEVTLLPFTGNGWGIKVSAGSLLAPVTGSGNLEEARPGTWSGKVESDNPPIAIGVLPADLEIPTSPSPSAGGPLAQWEAWQVLATVSEQTIETDSALAVFNQVSGAYDPPTSQPKVRQYKVGISVVRGSSNTPPFINPSAGVLLAVIYVPAGAGSHGNSIVFDCRKLLDQAPGPNRIGGSWRVGIAGQAADASAQVFQGHVWARLGGQILSARALTPLTIAQLTPTGLTWPAATMGSPQIAWLYLARPGGVVPRPVRRGVNGIGNDAAFGDALLIDGALTLSPVPPRLGLATASMQARSGLRWDLRPSATIALPTFEAAPMAHPWSGNPVGTDDALCVGFVRYTAVTSGRPMVYGPQVVDEQGWMSGAAFGVLTEAGLLSRTNTSDNTPTPRFIASAMTLATVTIGGEAFCLPLDAIRNLVDAVLTGGANRPARLTTSGAGAGRLVYPAGGGHAVIESEHRLLAPGTNALEGFRATLVDDQFDSWSPALTAVRFPYGVDLVG